MFEPVRGGTRGGQAEFKWSDVSADKDREVRRVAIRYDLVMLNHWTRRITWVTVSMPQPAVGKRTRMSIGTLGMTKLPRRRGRS